MARFKGFFILAIISCNVIAKQLWFTEISNNPGLVFSEMENICVEKTRHSVITSFNLKYLLRENYSHPKERRNETGSTTSKDVVGTEELSEETWLALQQVRHQLLSLIDENNLRNQLIESHESYAKQNQALVRRILSELKYSKASISIDNEDSVYYLNNKLDDRIEEWNYNNELLKDKDKNTEKNEGVQNNEENLRKVKSAKENLTLLKKVMEIFINIQNKVVKEMLENLKIVTGDQKLLDKIMDIYLLYDDDSLFVEISIPESESQLYKMMKLIEFPTVISLSSTNTIYILPRKPFLVINEKNDTYFFYDENQLAKCKRMEGCIICPRNMKFETNESCEKTLYTSSSMSLDDNCETLFAYETKKFALPTTDPGTWLISSNNVSNILLTCDNKTTWWNTKKSGILNIAQGCEFNLEGIQYAAPNTNYTRRKLYIPNVQLTMDHWQNRRLRNGMNSTFMEGSISLGQVSVVLLIGVIGIVLGFIIIKQFFEEKVQKTDATTQTRIPTVRFSKSVYLREIEKSNAKIVDEITKKIHTPIEQTPIPIRLEFPTETHRHYANIRPSRSTTCLLNGQVYEIPPPTIERVPIEGDGGVDECGYTYMAPLSSSKTNMLEICGNSKVT